MLASRNVLLAVQLGAVALLITGCDDEAVAPTAAGHGMHATSTVIAQVLEPFTVRAPLDPFEIHQLPGFLMHSKERSDIVIQRSVFAPGAGPWHTHPGPSFVYVIEGEIRLDRVTDPKKAQCESTPVHGPGQVYFEVGNQVHRAVVVSEESAVLLVVRFAIPVGQPFTIMAPAPGC